MTSLIDVIFLLLLFFMLSSTFARQGELPLDLAMGGAAQTPQTPPLFVQLREDGLRLNGTEASVDVMNAALQDAEAGMVLVSMAPGITAQALAEVLHLVGRNSGWSVAVIGGAS
ncbi:outer membrane transport energization protein ExbD [Roseicitreum antarcticum]|uniref:Outer membrane transport energization protein ExbD n=2 Tax=Roseicitreum antarcticum TaxID=564137 RepID=A0A1H2U8S3_9RHOB|nr:outer membrane transport energization protein ExbD [Roseicitreum antarcticum]